MKKTPDSNHSNRANEPHEKNRRSFNPNSPAVPVVPAPTFDSWKQVPKTVKTRRAWRRLDRQPIEDCRPDAFVLRPRYLADDEDIGDAFVIDADGSDILVSDFRVPLYKESSTKPYKRRPRTKAMHEFMDIFHRHARQDSWNRKSPNKIDPRENNCSDADWGISSWAHQTPEKHWDHWKGVLNESEIGRHLNHKQIVGVHNRDGFTRFVSIDLDYHSKDRTVFLEMAEILLKTFHGDGWFPMIRQRNISGLNLYKFFDSSRSLETEITDLRSHLISLDQQYPEIASRARAAGMSSFGELELFPTRPDLPVESHLKNCVRLPLCRGRLVATDKWLQPIKTKQGTIAPVESFMQWVNDPERNYMDPDSVLETLNVFTEIHGSSKRVISRPQQDLDLSPNKQLSRKNRAKSLMIDFWIHGKSNGFSLDAHILDLARHAYHYGYDINEAEYTIGELVRDLPATDCGSRKLANLDLTRIKHQVGRAVKIAYTCNGHQPDREQSSKKLAAVAQHFHSIGFDPLRPRTWSIQPVAIKTTRKPSEQQTAVLGPILSPQLKACSPSLIARFVLELIDLTVSKREQKWGDGYFRAWVSDRFPELKMGKKQKRINVLKTLVDHGVLIRVAKGSRKHGCSEWDLGVLGRLLSKANHNAGESTMSDFCFVAPLLRVGPAASLPDQLTFNGLGPSKHQDTHDLVEGIIGFYDSPSLLPSILAFPFQTQPSETAENTVNNDVSVSALSDSHDSPSLLPSILAFPFSTHLSETLENKALTTNCSVSEFLVNEGSFPDSS